MFNFKQLYCAVEVAKKIMADWSDKEDDIAILPSENVDAVGDDEDIDDDGFKINYTLSNDVCKTIQIQTNIPEIRKFFL